VDGQGLCCYHGLRWSENGNGKVIKILSLASTAAKKSAAATIEKKSKLKIKIILKKTFSESHQIISVTNRMSDQMQHENLMHSTATV
jgi:hypothetical protein